jgi:hypothetical protein
VHHDVEVTIPSTSPMADKPRSPRGTIWASRRGSTIRVEHEERITLRAHHISLMPSPSMSPTAGHPYWYVQAGELSEHAVGRNCRGHVANSLPFLCQRTAPLSRHRD